MTEDRDLETRKERSLARSPLYTSMINGEYLGGENYGIWLESFTCVDGMGRGGTSEQVGAEICEWMTGL